MSSSVELVGSTGNAPDSDSFLKLAVQILWRLDAFRESFALLSGHSCMGSACTYCALKSVFEQFQTSEVPNNWTNIPSTSHCTNSSFGSSCWSQLLTQLSGSEEAGDCFENLLNRIHKHLVPEDSPDHMCSADHCLPHQKMAMSICEQVVCSCGAACEPYTYQEAVLYVSAEALLGEIKTNYRSSFSVSLRNVVSSIDAAECPGNCGQSSDKVRSLLNSPDVVSIGLVWNSSDSKADYVQEVTSCIGPMLNLPELFHRVATDRRSPLHLVGVVCYYDGHYTSFMFHSTEQAWINWGEPSLKSSRFSWTSVCEAISERGYRPLLLFYMNPNSQTIPTHSALKYNTMAPGYQFCDGHPKDCHQSGYVSKSLNAANINSLPPPLRIQQRPERQDSGYYSVTNSSSEAGHTLVKTTHLCAKHAADDSSYFSITSSNSSNERSSTIASDEIYSVSQCDFAIQSDEVVPNVMRQLPKEKPDPPSRDLKPRLSGVSQLSTGSRSQCDEVLHSKRGAREASQEHIPSYATLSRRRKSAGPVAPTPHVSVEWMKQVAQKSEALKLTSPNTTDEKTAWPSQAVKPLPPATKPLPPATKPLPPASKPLPPSRSHPTIDTGAEPVYIHRNNVEKILSLQRKAGRVHTTSDQALTTPLSSQNILPFCGANQVSTRPAKGDPKHTPRPASPSAIRPPNALPTNPWDLDFHDLPTPRVALIGVFEPSCPKPGTSESTSSSTHIKEDSDEFSFPPPPSELELKTVHSKRGSLDSMPDQSISHRIAHPEPRGSLEGAIEKKISRPPIPEQRQNGFTDRNTRPVPMNRPEPYLNNDRAADRRSHPSLPPQFGRLSLHGDTKAPEHSSPKDATDNYERIVELKTDSADLHTAISPSTDKVNSQKPVQRAASNDFVPLSFALSKSTPTKTDPNTTGPRPIANHKDTWNSTGQSLLDRHKRGCSNSSRGHYGSLPVHPSSYSSYIGTNDGAPHRHRSNRTEQSLPMSNKLSSNQSPITIDLDKPMGFQEKVDSAGSLDIVIPPPDEFKGDTDITICKPTPSSPALQQFTSLPTYNSMQNGADTALRHNCTSNSPHRPLPLPPKRVGASQKPKSQLLASQNTTQQHIWNNNNSAAYEHKIMDVPLWIPPTQQYNASVSHYDHPSQKNLFGTVNRITNLDFGPTDHFADHQNLYERGGFVRPFSTEL